VAFWEEQLRRSVQEAYQDQSLRLFLFKRAAGAGGPGPEGPVIGTVNLTQIARGPVQSCNLGYGLDEREQGQGLMVEALRAVIPHAFDGLNLHRIQASYMPENARSARVLEKLGFVVEGRARDYIRINGVWRDHVLTGLINPAWRG
jgi:ribosomal-protein-alanine N-acetyltransferase